MYKLLVHVAGIEAHIQLESGSSKKLLTAWQKAILNLTAIPHLNGQLTQFPKILKSKQVLKRSQVKSGIDSIDLQT